MKARPGPVCKQQFDDETHSHGYYTSIKCFRQIAMVGVILWDETYCKKETRIKNDIHLTRGLSFSFGGTGIIRILMCLCYRMTLLKLYDVTSRCVCWPRKIQTAFATTVSKDVSLCLWNRYPKLSIDEVLAAAIHNFGSQSRYIKYCLRGKFFTSSWNTTCEVIKVCCAVLPQVIMTGFGRGHGRSLTPVTLHKTVIIMR